LKRKTRRRTANREGKAREPRRHGLLKNRQTAQLDYNDKKSFEDDKDGTNRGKNNGERVD